MVHAFEALRGRRGQAPATELDRQLGIETHQVVPNWTARVTGDNHLHGHDYQPVVAATFREVMSGLPTDLSACTFVDYGSGKGRALLLAAEFPFQRIIGVEYAQDLHEAAQRNLACASARLSGLDRVECLWADAAQFDPPEVPLVCFFFNPFDGRILRAVLEQLLRSVQDRPRDLWIAYVNPEHRQVLDVHPAVEPVLEGTGWMVYRVMPGAAPPLSRP